MGGPLLCWNFTSADAFLQHEKLKLKVMPSRLVKALSRPMLRRTVVFDRSPLYRVRPSVILDDPSNSETIWP